MSQKLVKCKNIGCSETFKYREQLRRHVAKCNASPPLYVTEERVTDHFSINGNEYQCLKCDVKIAHVNNLKRHILQCKGPKQEVYSCTSCEKDFKYHYKLKEHLKTHNKDYYSCERCSKNYQREHFYRQHLVTCAEFIPSFITAGTDQEDADVSEPEVQNENEVVDFDTNNPVADINHEFVVVVDEDEVNIVNYTIEKRKL